MRPGTDRGKSMGRGSYEQWAVPVLLITVLLWLTISGAMAQQKAERDALIGALEGPIVITDPAEWPRRFQEAPQLAELVQQRKLPPVQERLGSEPLVIKPVHEIGRYGGVWRRGFTGPGDKWNGYRCCSGP